MRRPSGQRFSFTLKGVDRFETDRQQIQPAGRNLTDGAQSSEHEQDGHFYGYGAFGHSGYAIFAHGHNDTAGSHGGG